MEATLHADVGEEFLACVLQACAEDIDRIVDNQETIVVVLTGIDSDRRIQFTFFENITDMESNVNATVSLSSG